MFKVGDLLVGNTGNGYPATDENGLCEVVSVADDGKSGNVLVVAHKLASFQGLIAAGIPIEGIDFSVLHLASEEEIAGFNLETHEEKEVKKKQKCLENYEFRAGLTIKNFDSGNMSSTFTLDRRKKDEVDEARKKALLAICEAVRDLTKEEVKAYDIVSFVDSKEECEVLREICGTIAIKNAMAKIIEFFKEFSYEPSFRMINTLALKRVEGLDEARDYIMNYFKVAGHSKATAIVDKMKSPEFTMILNAVGLCVPAERINNRLKVYFGSQGTGKTTLGMKEADDRCTLCNGSILPSDLLEDFNFNDGKPGFQGSILRKCLEEGKPIVLDEFNLLPFETVRFLQGILDGKKQFVYKGETINVKDGFSIIATMNLTVGGMTYGLPEPLVDRCYDIKEFVLTPENLMSALA